MHKQNIIISETGCYLDNHRGHYITRDAIELAVGYGFIIGGFERFALHGYDEAYSADIYPYEELYELCDDAVEWLNSGRDRCVYCGGSGEQVEITTATGERTNVICRHCSGRGRGPRIEGQNFPPRIPDGYAWAFNDGDFGLYSIEDELSD